MTSSFSMTPAGMKLTNGAGIDVFDTGRRTLGLVADAALTGTVALNYPTFITADAAYYYSRGSRDGTGDPPFAESCSTYGRIVAQNWGPGLPLHINRILLGAVPAHTDFIDVQVNLTQSAAPDLVLGTAILPAIVQGQWMSLPDHFATIEEKGTIKRGVYVELIDGQVYAALYQSAADQHVVAIQTQTDLNVSYLPPDPPFPHTVFWHFGYGDSNPCATAFSINLASSWSMTFKVTPGRHS